MHMSCYIDQDLRTANHGAGILKLKPTIYSLQLVTYSTILAQKGLGFYLSSTLYGKGAHACAIRLPRIHWAHDVTATELPAIRLVFTPGSQSSN